jgi:hypothetical protein
MDLAAAANASDAVSLRPEQKPLKANGGAAELPPAGQVLPPRLPSANPNRPADGVPRLEAFPGMSRTAQRAESCRCLRGLREEMRHRSWSYPPSTRCDFASCRGAAIVTRRRHCKRLLASVLRALARHAHVPLVAFTRNRTACRIRMVF